MSTSAKPGDVRTVVGMAGITKPADLVPQQLRKTALVALVDGEPWDLQRPIFKPGHVEIVDSTHSLGKDTLWHSSAHVLGQALEYFYRMHDVHLSDGPALEEGGFFYDLYVYQRGLQSPLTISSTDLPEITKICQAIVGEKQPFERVAVSVDFAKQVFVGNPFKQQILARIEEQAKQAGACASGNGSVTLYKCGPFIDLCRGPHIPHTGMISNIMIHKASASLLRTKHYFNVSNTAEESKPVEVSTVQRVYGMSFGSKSEYNEWQRAQQLAEKYDHRKVGKAQKLFMFHPFAPGSPFFLPHGTRVYNKLVEFIRKQYRARGFDEVRSPLVFDKLLWQQSGHWDKYKEDMFFVSKGHTSPPSAEPNQNVAAPAASQNVEVVASETGTPITLPKLHPSELGCVHGHAHNHSQAHNTDPEGVGIQGLKPMNCPGHCLLFASQAHSYRDLPVRYADFSTLHRNEISGALTGLTRVRSFAQDDAHIFCTKEQLGDELRGCLDFVKHVYGIFEFPLEFKLSTRPENAIGDRATWDLAESVLVECLNNNGLPWEENPGDGAFYGPKVDITVRDGFGRRHQCATIQLDFNLPVRFGLKYKAADGSEQTPVMIHRAVLGSLERFMGVYMEHCLGKWPLWLSPRQIAICIVSPDFVDYAQSVANQLKDAGFFVDLSDATQSLAKQIRQAQLMQYNYMVVVGENEVKTNTVSVRHRDQHRAREEQKEEARAQQTKGAAKPVDANSQVAEAAKAEISVEDAAASNASNMNAISVDEFIRHLKEEVEQYK